MRVMTALRGAVPLQTAGMYLKCQCPATAKAMSTLPRDICDSLSKFSAGRGATREVIHPLNAHLQAQLNERQHAGDPNWNALCKNSHLDEAQGHLSQFQTAPSAVGNESPSSVGIVQQNPATWTLEQYQTADWLELELSTLAACLSKHLVTTATSEGSDFARNEAKRTEKMLESPWKPVQPES